MTISVTKLPLVVIAGRPNVGKSTLFNRLYGRHRAITAPQAGVTRDLIEESCTLGGIPLRLVDSGGVGTAGEGEYDAPVTGRSLRILGDADLVLFLVDVHGVTGEDQILIEILRKRGVDTVLVVNKADTPEKDYEAQEFYELGFGEPVPVSAVHGRNMDSLIKVIKEKLGEPETADIPERETDLQIALVGRPNAGKSTLLNAIADREVSLVSAVPGTTRDTVTGETEFENRHIRVIDTAGIRRRRSVGGNVEYYSVNRAIKAMSTADVSVLLIDSREGLSQQDKKIAAQVVKKGRPLILALSKWDGPDTGESHLQEIKDRVRFQFPVLEWAPLLPVSALKGRGIDKLLAMAVKIDRQQRRRVETAPLNRAVAEWLELHPLPSGKGPLCKLLYITQVNICPPRFIAFVNRCSGFPESYRRSMINRIRREFDFSLVPIVLELRENRT